MNTAPRKPSIDDDEHSRHKPRILGRIFQPSTSQARPNQELSGRLVPEDGPRPWGGVRLLYIDTHAGRGKHLSGELGSPLVALNALLKHTSRDKLLQKTEVRYFFIERDAANVAALNAELATHILPTKVFAKAEHGDSFHIIENAITTFEKDGKQLAPGFIFVDPYGFKLPGQLLRQLMGYPKVELFVNVIWRELDMAIQNVREDSKSRTVETSNNLFGDEIDPEKSKAMAQRREDTKLRLEQTLNSVFDGDGWRKIDADETDDRAEQCADLFREITKARWGTHIRMLNNGRIRYFLLHLTNHDDGRDLMKKCMWKVCPHGGFSASKADNPRQVVLIEPKPNLKPLQDWVRAKLLGSPKRWQELADNLREELWLEKHLNKVIRDMRSEGDIATEGFTEKFALTNNPLLRILPKQRTLFEA